MPRRTKSQLTSLSVITLSLSAFACTGVMEGTPPGGGATSSTGATTGTGGSANNPGTGGTGNGASTPVDMEAAKTMPVDPGRVEIHRLNSAEYNATVMDVLGTTLQPATDAWRGGELGGFDNIAAVLGMDGDQYQRYFDAADLIVEDVFGDPARASKFVVCATTDDACVKQVVDKAGLLIFRRPLTTEEVATYTKVYADAKAQGDNHNASVKLVVRALLSSAEFLYRIEFDADPNSTNKHPLSAYELASRLSYFLWSSAPDETLLTNAANGSLNDTAALSQAVDYMLADKVKSNRLVSNFAGQWLGARRVITHPTAPDVYPAWNADIATAAAEEMYLYFNEFLRTGKSWLDFVQADMNFVNPTLAAFYGMPATGSGTVKVENTTDNRKGFIGLAGFLAMSSPDRRTSPTLRGKWLLLNMMCVHIEPPAGLDIPTLDAKKGDTTNLNIRDVLAEHRSNPQCASCHAIIDPFGLALEKFDGIGKFRETYANGSAIDDTTELAKDPATYPDGLKFQGLNGAADAVTQNPAFKTCISEKLLTYGVGRLPTETDKPYLQLVNDEWLKAGATPSIDRLIKGLVTTELFRFRRGEGQ
jgi:hypothetical protein